MNLALSAGLILAIGLFYAHSKKTQVSTPVESSEPATATDAALKQQMDGVGLNNPRNDLHVSSIAETVPASYASVDVTRHKAVELSAKDADGDKTHLTSLGRQISELKTPSSAVYEPMIHAEAHLKNNLAHHEINENSYGRPQRFGGGRMAI